MKKKAFTLAEILIAFGAIGIIAAVTAPMLGSLLPDENKVKVLKYHKVISEINNELYNDKSLYIDNMDEAECIGYNCTIEPINPNYKDKGIEKDKKFGALFVDKMDSVVSESIGNPTYFILADGSTWAISWKQDSGNIEIMIDVNGDTSENQPNCSYLQGCKKIDRFNFMIDCETGKLTGNDPITVAYLKNPLKLNDKKADYKTAKEDKTVYKYREEGVLGH